MMRNLTPIVKQLLIINVLFFIGANILGSPALDYLAMHYPENHNFYFWQPLTSMFLHFDVMHLAFNMFAVYMFGPVVEEQWGSTKFLFFYLSCGLGARLVTYAVDYYSFQQGIDVIVAHGMTKAEALSAMSESKIYNVWQEWFSGPGLANFFKAYASTSLGASGAISGILVAFAVMYPNALLSLLFIPVPIKAKYLIGGIFAIDLIIGLAGKSFIGVGDGVGHFAHFGGALTGFLMAWYWSKNQPNPNRWN